MKRFFKIAAAFVGLVILGAAGAALLMPSEDFKGQVELMPGIGSHGGEIADQHAIIREEIGYWYEDVIYSAKSTWRDITGFSTKRKGPRVVIELEPVRTKAKPQPEPARPAPVETAAAPMKLMPGNLTSEAESAEAAEATAEEKMETAAAEPTPETPEQVKTEPAAPISLTKSPQVPAEPPPAPAPPAVPVKEVEQAALAPEPAKAPEKTPEAKPQKKPAQKQAAPLPPPPAPENDTGDMEHKRGLTYYKGLGVEKNFKVAAEWFEKAAAKGHAAAQYNLGIMAYLGQGGEKSYKRAAEWFRLAAEQDHALAQYNLGFLFYEGKGVEKDDLQAFMWIDRAAGLGDEKAIKARDTLAKILPKDIYQRK